MAEEGVAGAAQKAGSGIGKIVTWVLVLVFGFAGYAKPGWPFSFKDVAEKLLGWINIGAAGTGPSPSDIANLIAAGITGAIGGVLFGYGHRHGKIVGAIGMIGGAWMIGKAIRHLFAGLGVK